MATCLMSRFWSASFRSIPSNIPRGCDKLVRCATLFSVLIANKYLRVTLHVLLPSIVHVNTSNLAPQTHLKAIQLVRHEQSYYTLLSANVQPLVTCPVVADSGRKADLRTTLRPPHRRPGNAKQRPRRAVGSVVWWKYKRCFHPNLHQITEMVRWPSWLWRQVKVLLLSIA